MCIIAGVLILAASNASTRAEDTFAKIDADSSTNPERLRDLAAFSKDVALPQLFMHLTRNCLAPHDPIKLKRADVARQTILSIPAWNTDLAVELDALAQQVNENAGAQERANRMRESKPEHMNQEQEVALLAALRAAGNASGAQEEFAQLVFKISCLNNDQAIALIGPYLMMKSHSIWHGDYSTPSAEEAVANALHNMKYLGKAIPDAPEYNDVKEWQAWWGKNAPRYQSAFSSGDKNHQQPGSK